MAGRAQSVRPPLTAEAVRELFNGAPAGQLGALHFPIQGASAPDANLVWAGIAMIRENGFMIVIPVAELVHQAVLDLSPADGSGEPIFHQGQVELVNSRGRSVGPAEAELVDLPGPL